MKENLKWYLFGIGMIAVGVLMYHTGYSARSGAPVTKGASIFIIILGISCIPLAAYFHRKIKNRKLGNEFYVCTECEKKYPKEWVELEICPKCNHKLSLENSNQE